MIRGMIGQFDPRAALLGGLLVGVGLVLLLLASQRPVGVSGVIAGVLTPKRGEAAWRLAFLGGLVLGGLLLNRARPGALAFDVDRSLPTLVIAGALVGLGTRLGNGCTSGHGVCGIGSLSIRSLVATAIFLSTGAGTLYVVKHLFGGRL
jgi:uncharacterized membrane protein YedE/YeeE